MGTNYYARTKICKCCNRFDEVHIGKSSGGWTFSFQATEQIKSYPQWIAFLKLDGVEIWNEYNEKVSLKEFMELVEAKRQEENNHAEQYPEGSFLDKDGNSFSEGDFS